VDAFFGCRTWSYPCRRCSFAGTGANDRAFGNQGLCRQAAITDVHTARSGATFIDMGGEFPDNEFVAVIFADDAAKFPDASSLEGKTVTITGTVQMYQGKPEIVLKSASQLKTK
jgi:hypothetical protein